MNELILSIFPGIDLLGRAFEEEGFCVVRGPDLVWGGDVRTFHPPAGKFEGVTGGPPCQMFSSLAHLVRANGNEPKFGNLIPEFERCVREAAPLWFLMEEVPAAPVPIVSRYAVKDFVLANQMLDSGNGFGNEQIRKRRFSFGIKGAAPIDLRKWIRFAALELPDAGLAVTRSTFDNSQDHHKKPAVLGEGYDAGERPAEKKKRTTVTTDAREGTSGDRVRKGKGGTLPHVGKKRTWAECCKLQGMPEDFLAEAPFTQAGKNRVLGNGVPLMMGRQIAMAIRKAIE